MVSAAAAISSAALSGKTRKIVPSRDAGGLGDLLVVDAAAVLQQQRHDDVDDRAAAVVGGHRRGAVRCAGWRGSPGHAK